MAILTEDDFSKMVDLMVDRNLSFLSDMGEEYGVLLSSLSAVTALTHSTVVLATISSYKNNDATPQEIKKLHELHINTLESLVDSVRLIDLEVA